MNSKKCIAWMISIILILSIMAGCTNSYTPDDAASGSESSAETADVGPGNSAGGEVLTMMMNGTETDSAYKHYQGFISGFNADNEFGVTLEAEFYENEQYKTKLTTLMASNSVPDVFFTWELDYLRPFVDGGKVLDITDMLEADQELKNSFQEGVLEPLTYDGRVFALPSQTCFAPMFYNTQIFEDNGLTPPETWEEFIELCETLKNLGITPMVVQAADAWIASQVVQQLINGLGGTEIYNDLLAGDVAWNNDVHVQAGELFQELVDAGYMQPGFLGMKQEEGRMILLEGNAAMHYMGSWEISTLIREDSKIKDTVSAFALPAVDPQYSNILVGSVDSSFGIFSGSENPEAAFGLIKYWVSEENQETLLYETGRLPATKIDVDRSRVDPLTADCLDISDRIVGLVPWLDRAFGAGEGVEFNNTVLAICGGEDPQTAFDNLQRYVEDTVSVN